MITERVNQPQLGVHHTKVHNTFFEPVFDLTAGESISHCFTVTCIEENYLRLSRTDQFFPCFTLPVVFKTRRETEKQRQRQTERQRERERVRERERERERRVL